MTTAGDPAVFFASVAAEHRRCFWLDGGGAREWSGRQSIIGWLDDDDVSLSYSAERREVTRHAGGRAEVVGHDVFAVLEAELAAGAVSDQWFGYLGYAARADLPARPDPDLPDAVWMRARHVRLFEHDPDTSAVPPLVETGADSAVPPLVETGADSAVPPLVETGADGAVPPLVEEVALATVSKPPPDYVAAFDRVQEHLHAGNSYEVNLTHRVVVDSPADPVATYLRLRALNPAPYAGFLQHDVAGARAWLLSSSPERYALLGPGGAIETKPIKGTTPRGASAQDDDRLRAELATHPRYRAENLMIVDLLRNDLAQVCEVGSVAVPALMQVESYASVHQLVSTVRGQLRSDVGLVGALHALFPAGSMTGAPKLRTMQVIEEVEATPRGVYSGAFGWISGAGGADLGVIIRSLTTAGPERGSWTYRLGTGGGITVLSDVGEEWDEASLKAERVLAAVDGVSQPDRTGRPWPPGRPAWR